MRLFSARNSIRKGFTLIELLVVIGILGILAAALVATIDPFEQLKKANDANTQNALVEYINAVTRYYTTHNAFPWDAAGASCNSAAAPSGLTLSSAGMVTCTTALTGDNELKAAFTSSAALPLIYISFDSTLNQTTGCYNPKSKSVLHNANTKWSNTGSDLSATTCSNANKDANATSCYWCTK